MIKLTSFYPFLNFLQTTQEFDDEKVSIKNKSLSVESQRDVIYKDISKLQYRLRSNWPEINFGIATAAFVGPLFFILSIFGSELPKNIAFLWLGRTCYIIGIMLAIAGFRKTEGCHLFDKNENYLTTIEVSASNEEGVDAAINLIKQASPNVSETDPDNPFPETKHLIEYISYDIPDFMSKSTTRLYENELIDYEKSFTDEVVIKIKYSDLTNQITRLKQGNSNWSSLGCLLLSLSMIPISFFWLFRINSYINKIEYYVLIPISILLLALGLWSLFFMGFFKEEIALFYNKNNQIIYGMKITRASKEKAETILEFIKSKTSHQHTDKQNEARNEA